MNKEQVIAEAARKGGLTQKEVRSGLNAVIEVLVEAFENDTNVAIAGLGTFQVKKRSNVKKYLPKNGSGPVKGVTGGRAMIAVSERRCIRFNPAPYINREYSLDSTRPTPTDEDKSPK